MIKFTKIVKLVVLILAVAWLSKAAFIRNTLWQDEITLWEDVAKKSANKARVHNNLGKAYASQVIIDKALEHYLIAINLRPDYADAHLNLGLILFGIGAKNKAREEIGIALKINPDDTMAQKFLDYISKHN